MPSITSELLKYAQKIYSGNRFDHTLVKCQVVLTELTAEDRKKLDLEGEDSTVLMPVDIRVPAAVSDIGTYIKPMMEQKKRNMEELLTADKEPEPIVLTGDEFKDTLTKKEKIK